MSVETPVALFIFNRPDLTQKLFERVRIVRPSRLLIVADGPRAGRPGDRALCEQARKVFDAIDWLCEVKKNYSDANLGCRLRMSSGISWVFENEEDAILLEDDCIPDIRFFTFASEMLRRYSDTVEVGMISGNNFQNDSRVYEASYYFSKYVHIWGWATWRRAWLGYDVQMKDWPAYRDAGLLRSVLKSQPEIEYWTKIFDDVYFGKIDTWDYQWVFTSFKRRLLSIVPAASLVLNHGFRSDATHTIAGAAPVMSLRNIAMIDGQLIHPRTVDVAEDADHYEFSRILEAETECVRNDFSRPTALKKCLRRIKRALKNVTQKLSRVTNRIGSFNA